jgi:hypothetical protein
MNLYKKIIISSLAFTLYTSNIWAQLEWNSTPTIHKIDEKYNKESLVVILDERKLSYENEEKSNTIYLKRTLHRIIKLIDEKGVESQNKQIIPIAYNSKIISLKCRLIKTNGKTIEISEQDIKKSKNINGYEQYHVAYEEANIGDEIEYIIEEEIGFRPFGTEIMQFGIPILNSKFEISSPNNFMLDCKSYNNFSSINYSFDNNRHVYTAIANNIDALEEEKYADIALNTKKIKFKINNPTDNKEIRLYTWDDLAYNKYEYIYNISNKEQKAIQKFIKSLNINKKDTEEVKIKKLEEVLKNDITLNENLDEEKYKDIEVILEGKTTFERAFVRLWVNCLEALDIKHETGLVTNKFFDEWDEEFEDWNTLEIASIFIHKTNQFILPTYKYLRYPALTPETEGAKGVFVKRIINQDKEIAIANYRTLHLNTYDNNVHHLSAQINFNAQLEPIVNTENSFKGLSANGMRELATFLKKEEEKQLILTLVDYIENEDNILEYKIVNRGINHYQDNKPLIISAKVRAPKIIEKAADKFILKIGDVIGRQEELYQAHTRQHPMSMPFSHLLTRELTIDIPKGYTISNLEKINRKLDYQDKFGFESHYELSDNKLRIIISEYYSLNNFPASVYDDFRNVINAAADFNKLSLILEKK